MAERWLALIRHAHRDTTQGVNLDNGISQRGQEQVAWLENVLKTQSVLSPILDQAQWVSSPLIRCQETLAPLAKKFLKEPDLSIELETRREDEAKNAFRRRVKGVMHQWLQRRSELEIWCTHGDWIPAALQHITGTVPLCRKGSLIVLRLEDGDVELAEIRQPPTT